MVSNSHHFITRQDLIEKIKPFLHNTELIKILVGMRRVGKSILLQQLEKQIILDGIKENNIIKINFELLENSDLTTAASLNEFLVSKIKTVDTYYILIDEIQYVENFEKVINSIRTSHNVSIIVTGSNSKLLSGDLRTLLSGRYVSFNIPSFSFSEVCKIQAVKSEDYDRSFNNYIFWGGLPGRFELSEENSTRNYLTDVFDSIAARDVIERGKIHNTSLLMSLLRYLLETMGNLFSAQKTANYLGSIGRKASRETIYNYLDLLSSALILQKCERYNVSGKEIMTNSAKYYATDVGIMQIKASPNTVNFGSTLENIVFNELKRREYAVYVGYLESGEIDFVAIKDNQIKYIQVTTYLDGNTELQEREFRALESVNDNYEKYLISLDKTNMSKNGIKHINIIDWLLGKDDKGIINIL